MQLNSKQKLPNKHHSLQQQTKMFREPLQFEKRRCTDVCCIYVAVSFFSICIALSFGLRNTENVIKINYPSDSDGRVCGIDFPQYPNIYFTNFPQINERVCVASCPSIDDTKLNCTPTSSIICSFGQTVRFTETTLQSYQNSNICMPVNSKVSKSLIRAGQIQSRISLSNPVILLTLQFALGLSIITLILINYFPKMMIETVQYLSLIFEILLAIIIYASKTEHVAVKYLTLFLLSSVFLITLSQILLFRHELKLNRVFIIQSSKFMQLNKGLSVYIVVFEVLLFCFLQLLFTMYNSFLSSAKLSFEPQKSLYYTPKSVNNSMIAMLAILGVWGISIIQQLYKFFITAHTINWYLHLPNNLATIKYTCFKLLHKHIGSVIASAFINGFLFVPKMIYDLLFVCANNNEHSTNNNYCSSILDLARADTLSFVILAGLPFCNSSRYCDYFWSQTMISQKNQSSIRAYKISGHTLIAIICSIIGLLTRDQLDNYLLLSTLIIGLLIGTFFIDFNAICAQTLQLLYIMEQEFSKRPEGKAKVVMNLLNRADQLHFINIASQLFKNEEVGQQITNIKKNIWKIDTKPKILDKKHQKEQLQLDYPKYMQKELVTQQQQT